MQIHLLLKNSAFQIFCVLLSIYGFVLAQDEGLYAPTPPDNAAFLRVVHIATDEENVSVSVANTNYGELGFAEVTPYRIVLEGKRAVNAGSIEDVFDVESGNFYTAFFVGDSIDIVVDATNLDRSKALLALYNYSTLDSVDLKTADGSTDVITGIAPKDQANIAVNGITVALGVFTNGGPVTIFDEVQLERGAAYSAIVFSSEGQPEAVFVRSETVTD